MRSGGALMVSGGGGITWTGDNLVVNLAEFEMKVKRGMVAAAHFTSGQAEAYMKSRAPWTDRTGAARNGLGTQVITSTDKVAIVLYHSVAYGPFLEVRWGGKYAVIDPTMAAIAPLYLDA